MIDKSKVAIFNDFYGVSKYLGSSLLPLEQADFAIVLPYRGVDQTVRRAGNLITRCSSLHVKMVFVSTPQVFSASRKIGGYKEKDKNICRDSYGLMMFGLEVATTIVSVGEDFRVVRWDGYWDGFALTMWDYLNKWDQMPSILHVGPKNKSWFHNGLNTDLSRKLGLIV